MKKFVTKMSIGLLILFSAISISVFSSCGKKETKTEDEEKYKMTEEDALANLNFSFVLTTIDGVEGYSVFRLKWSSRTELTIPDTFMGKPVIAISESAFSYSPIEKITIGSNVKIIYERAFRFCEFLTDVSIKEESRLETIGDLAFWECHSIESITIPASVKTIGIFNTYNSSGAFCGCTSLKSVTFEEGSQLETIGEWTFYDCMFLTEITIPASVKTIGDYAFPSSYDPESENYFNSIIFEANSQLETIGYYALGLVGGPPATGHSHSITILGDLTNVTNILEKIFNSSNSEAREPSVTLFVDSSIVSEVTARNDGFISVQAIVD